MEFVHNTINFKEDSDMCENCARRKLFDKKCKFYWHGKEECGSWCATEKEMIELDNLRYGSWVDFIPTEEQIILDVEELESPVVYKYKD